MKLIKQHVLWVLFGILAVAVFMPIGISLYQFITIGHWPAWTGFGEQITPDGEFVPAKNYWDVLGLIVVPLSLSIIAYFFSRAERHVREHIEERRYLADKEIQAEKSRSDALQAYIVDMSRLLLDYNLQNSDIVAIVRDIAHARTVTTLRDLDSTRKGSIVRFLYAAQLITVGTTVVSLSDVDLRGINLVGVNCYGASFSGANIARGIFFRADLRNASFKRAYLEEANFRLSDLRGTNFSAANLMRVDFSDCLLEGADLSYANLQQAIISDSQLQQVASLSGTIMPDGKQHKVIPIVKTTTRQD